MFNLSRKSNSPKSFPFNASDSRLEELYVKFSRDFGDDTVPNYELDEGPAVQVIASEMQRRSNKRTIRILIAISLISLFVSVVAVRTSFTGLRSSKAWETAQLEVLNLLHEDYEAFNSLFFHIIEKDSVFHTTNDTKE